MGGDGASWKDTEGLLGRVDLPETGDLLDLGLNILGRVAIFEGGSTSFIPVSGVFFFSTGSGSFLGS